ncbi:MAG: 7-cyano-7-deazaguanine synthase, partial [Opitutales bacterium]
MKSIVVHSGGMDSTVLLYQLVSQGDEVKALSIDYGQRHAKEIECARALAENLGVEHRVADLCSLNELLGGSALTSPEVEVPEGHYAEENMKATVVPNRNMILLAVAAGWAISSEYDRVAYAAHAG